ncbi:MAG: hypothetical protein RLZZ102_637 [Pseudomonadota bacterium]|jgi:hypothetical protein
MFQNWIEQHPYIFAFLVFYGITSICHSVVKTSAYKYNKNFHE